MEAYNAIASGGILGGGKIESENIRNGWVYELKSNL